jgi:hypothetical protein
MRPRDLRGSFASQPVNEVRNIVEVATRMGHSPETCLNNESSVDSEEANG